MSWLNWRLSWWQLGATAAREGKSEYDWPKEGLASWNIESWLRGYAFAKRQMLKEQSVTPRPV
jgi:hypothetical protein